MKRIILALIAIVLVCSFSVFIVSKVSADGVYYRQDGSEWTPNPSGLTERRPYEFYSPLLTSDAKYLVNKQSGVERVTSYDPRVNFARIETTVYMEPLAKIDYTGVGRGGEPPFYPRATGRVKSYLWAGFPRAQVNINTIDLPASDKVNGQYEVWLFDDDSSFQLSLGTFTTLGGGVGEFKYDTENYLDAYDKVVISLEPYDDDDVAPHTLILQGNIPEPVYFDPAPKQSKLITPVFTTN